jgi:hypothetical protein
VSVPTASIDKYAGVHKIKMPSSYEEIVTIFVSFFFIIIPHTPIPILQILPLLRFEDLVFEVCQHSRVSIFWIGLHHCFEHNYSPISKSSM